MAADTLPRRRRAVTGWPDGRPALLAFLPRFLFFDDGAAWRYILFAWPIAAVPALLLGWVAARLAPGLGSPTLLDASLPTIVVLVVFVSPFFETCLLAIPAMYLNRWFGPLVAALVSAVGWACVHSLEAARWGLVIWWPFLIFTIAFLTWQRRGFWSAVGVATAIHILNNAGPIAVLALTR